MDDRTIRIYTERPVYQPLGYSVFQLPMFAMPETERNVDDLPDLGTFKDSLKAPVHSWFRYPAGYSYKFVEGVFRQAQLGRDSWVYDPFSGSGTTLLCAQAAGLNGYGVEAHSFVHWVSDVKLFRGYDWDRLGQQLAAHLVAARAFVAKQAVGLNLHNVFPPLIYKCYHPDDLAELYLMRSYILEVADPAIRDLLKLALTDVLRSAAAAGTGWPYIAPRKNTGDKPPKGALSIFDQTISKMYADLQRVRSDASLSTIQNILGDSRTPQPLEDGQIDLALTSPPYLNNFDYADRTRLETYFWGITQNWAEITRDFRDHLIVSATTQVIRSKYDVETVLDASIRAAAPATWRTIQDSILRLAALRQTKGGKKDYDLMVGLYFNDLFAVLKEARRVIRRGGMFHLVLGDSAPYGVHIQTDQLIGQLGLAAGFDRFTYQEFRSRGGKWKANPQRHTVPLREGVVILTQ